MAGAGRYFLLRVPVAGVCPASAHSCRGKAEEIAFSYVSLGANASMTGESKAYQTYGSTLAYSDYYDAKKDAKNLGSPYGYTYDEVMNASSTNMSLAGFTSIENYKNDMDALLGTSKAWGINSSSLASTSGYMSSIGVQ